MSRRLVDDFVRPTLAVGLFAPLEQLSAAVAMELLYFYAFAHTDSFDVRWIASKSIPELLIAPLAARLTQRHGLTVLPRARVAALELSGGRERVTGIRYVDGADGDAEKVLGDIDAVVLAVGAKGLRSIMAGTPALAAAAPELAAAAALGSIDVITTRLWLDRRVETPHPANVLSRFPALRGAGGTFFMLDALQADGGRDAPGMRRLWGLPPDDDGAAGAAAADASTLGSVVAADFYFSPALALLSDDDIVSLLIDELLPAAVPGFAGAKVVDSFVLRCPGAVSWFSPGSYPSRPPLHPAVGPLRNLACAGDWVRMGEREHGAKGLCQERALVSGYEAANSLLRDGLPGLSAEASTRHLVLPVRPDEPQVVAGRAAAKAAADALSALGINASPWVR
jgi:uncharacterized protein with NAD-binding domain and iron-sulfur cluster